jgi:oligopeptide transport system substrate-binding protein
VQLSTKRVRAAAALVALSLAAAACSDGGGSDDQAGGDGSGGTFSIQIADPENPLVPGNTTESEGNQVLQALFTGLITYDVETTEVQYDGVAESIESDDNITWTVTLKDGWTFHDGSPVTASSFVDAWNYAADPANAFGGSYFFGNITGYDELQEAAEGEGGAASAPPTDPSAAEKLLAGLEVVDDQTFTVELTDPFSQFPLTVGYTAFYPLPEAFFDDPEAFGKKPIGNGPFKADTEFVPGQGITMSRYEDYAGDVQPQADGIEMRVYSDLNTAFNDLQAGNLDITDAIPPELIATADEELGDRYLERPAAGFDYLGFPTYDARFQDKRVRQAISMAINREEIVEAVYNGSRTPARDVIPPVIDGHREDACEFCVYDPEAAKALLDETDFDTSKPLELWFNAGAGHDLWVQAAGNQLRENLGVDYVLKGDLEFAEYLPLLDDKGITGPFRLGWGMDYPSPQNFLEPLFSTGALPPNGSNATFYSNPEFDRLIEQGNSAESIEEGIEFYQQADDVLLEDMPIAPMWFRKTQGARSENVSNVQFDAFQNVVLEDVTVE